MKKADCNNGIWQVKRLQICSRADLNSSPSKEKHRKYKMPHERRYRLSICISCCIISWPAAKRPTKCNYTLIVSISHFLCTLAGEVSVFSSGTAASLLGSLTPYSAHSAGFLCCDFEAAVPATTPAASLRKPQ